VIDVELVLAAAGRCRVKDDGLDERYLIHVGHLARPKRGSSGVADQYVEFGQTGMDFDSKNIPRKIRENQSAWQAGRGPEH
jgi:hypothetical protein